MLEDSKNQSALLPATSTDTSSSTSSGCQDIEVNFNIPETVDPLDDSSSEPSTTRIQPLWRWPWQRNRRRGGRS